MAATGFVMVFPAFVGLISTESQIYEQTIATGGLWSVLLLSGVLLLLHRCTAGRLVAVCAAAAFSTMIRPPLAIYGATTVALAMIIARRRGMGRGALIAGLASCAGVTALYLSGNALRFGSPFNAGFANIVSVTLVNRLTRWGLSFTKVPFTVAAKEMGLTLFSLETIGADAMRWRPPPSLARYTVGERWREYYSQTYDWFVLAVWIAALGIVCYRVVVGRLWRRDRTLGDETVTAVGLWALPPAIALFVFYARLPNMVTRYFTDMYPAFAAASLCVGMAIVDVVRTRAPARTPSAQMAIAGAVALYMAGDRGWVMHVSHPVDRDTIVSRIARVDARSADMPDVPQHFECGEPRGRSPMYMHLEGWGPDCSFPSGMVFAMRHSPCVSFTLSPGSGSWGAGENESLAGFRATGDFDALVRCGPPALDGDVRRVTMCDPGPPPFLLDGMRLYAIASLDADLNPLDRLKLVRIDAAQSCPAGP
jgi:hypothetical protein